MKNSGINNFFKSEAPTIVRASGCLKRGLLSTIVEISAKVKQILNQQKKN